jgi:hypothetical protein
MKRPIKILAAMTLILAVSCGKMQEQPQAVVTSNTSSFASTAGNGKASSIPAYYDSVLFTIHFVEFSPAAETSHIAHDKNINFIYQSDPGLPDNQPFISVIDAIPGDGMNPVWREVQIAFNTGHTPRQLYSDDEVLAASVNGEVTLDTTNEVYWCPVVGHK